MYKSGPLMPPNANVLWSVVKDDQNKVPFEGDIGIKSDSQGVGSILIPTLAVLSTSVFHV